MNKFETELLQQSYNSYQKTGSLSFDFVMSTSDDFFYYPDAAKYLAENEYIDAISDNIFDNSISPFDNILTFILLPKGIEYIQNLK